MRNERLLWKVAKKILNSSDLNQLNQGIDVIGDIAVIKISKNLEKERFNIAEALLQETPYIKVIFQQTKPISGDYRTRILEWLSGEKREVTFHREYGCVFKVNVRTVYFSPRLSYERMRIAKNVQKSYETFGKREKIVNMFSGVGCFSIIIAKNALTEMVYSIDLNPYAVELMNENILINKVVDRVRALHGDARNIVESHLSNIADRVLMPLPEKAYDYIDTALLTLKPCGGWVHYQEFVFTKQGENPITKSVERLSKKLLELKVNYQIPSSRIIRSIGPRWYQIVLDLQILSNQK